MKLVGGTVGRKRSGRLNKLRLTLVRPGCMLPWASSAAHNTGNSPKYNLT